MLNKFLSNKKGNFASIFAIAMVPLLAGVAMTLEYNNLSNNHARLQSATDAAILFAGRYLDANDVLPNNADVRAFVEANFEDPISSVNLSKANGRLVIDVQATVPAFFFGNVYPEVFDQETTASVPFGGKSYLEMALVLDSTGSMKDDNKMTTLKTVVTELMDDMESAQNSKNTIKVGLVPFSQYVNVGTANSNKSWVSGAGSISGWEGCVGSRAAPNTLMDGSLSVPFPAVKSTRCPSALTELTSNFSALRASANAMVAQGATYAADGVMWGMRVLSQQAPFTDGKPLNSLPFSVNHQKVMVLLTDGDNTRAPNLPWSPLHNSGNIAIADANTRAACAAARAAGVTIYSVAFGTSMSTEGEAVLRDCADDPSRYFGASNADALRNTFKKIFSDVMTLRLSS